MTRIFDAFLFCDELDMLELRLTELEDVPDLTHVLVESTRTHGGNHKKDLIYRDNKERFAKWADRIHAVIATDMSDSPNPWEREHEQREWFHVGLSNLHFRGDAIVLQSDVDEIPRAFVVDALRKGNRPGDDPLWVLEQTPHYLALDWTHPERWRGTTIASYGDISSFAAMRHARFTAPLIPNGGWHLSWLGGPDAVREKIERGCHPEFEGYDAEAGLLEGIHVDGKEMRIADWESSTVDDTYPRWIREGNAPSAWFRDYWLDRLDPENYPDPVPLDLDHLPHHAPTTPTDTIDTKGRT